mgnify:FL=1
MPRSTHQARINANLLCCLHHNRLRRAEIFGRHVCPGLLLRQANRPPPDQDRLLRMTCNRDLNSVLLQSILSLVSCDGFCVQVSAG